MSKTTSILLVAGLLALAAVPVASAAHAEVHCYAEIHVYPYGSHEVCVVQPGHHDPFFCQWLLGKLGVDDVRVEC